MSTDWENHYQRQETPWDKGAAHPALLSFLKQQPMRGNVLVPGCGLGHDVRALAATGDEVVGLDIAPSAISQAKKIPAVGGERYVKGDLFALPPALQGVFDWVWEHTCFCAINPERRTNYVEAVRQALLPGGYLLACFYLDPGLDPEESGPPFGTSREELHILFQKDFELIQEWLPELTYPGREGREWMQLLRRR